MKNQSKSNPQTEYIQSVGRALRTGKAKESNLELIGLERNSLKDMCIPDKKTGLNNQDEQEEKEKS